MKILLRMRLWIKKSPLSGGSDPYTDRLRVQTGSVAAPAQQRNQRSFRGYNILEPGHPDALFPQKKLTTFSVGRQSRKIGL